MSLQVRKEQTGSKRRQNRIMFWLLQRTDFSPAAGAKLQLKVRTMTAGLPDENEEIYRRTGRAWALILQLAQSDAQGAEALVESPEVCLHLRPLSRRYRARAALRCALQISDLFKKNLCNPPGN